MHITSRPNTISIAALLALSALAACYPSNPHQLGNKLVVHGVVTDLGTGNPLPGVKVTLLSIDDFAPLTTNAQGYFQFSDVLQQQNLLVQFQMAGYITVTIPVNPTLIEDGGTGDGGAVSFGGFGSGVDGFDASIALSQDLTVAVAGIVLSGPTAAAGAQVMLTTLTGTPVYQTTTAMDGSFTFPSVRANQYDLVVLPWDRDGDGLTDTQFFLQQYSFLAASGADFGHIVVNLADVQKSLVGSSFVNLSRAYPITSAQLLTGVTGILQATGGTLFLTFGAEVDPSTTSFSLVQVESLNGVTQFSPPIALTVAWTHGVTAQLTPGAALQASDSVNIGYQLRINSLRFADGTVGITATPNVFGAINFTVQSLPVALTNPQPSVYLANQFAVSAGIPQNTLYATKAVFDASNAWLLDANGDFVFDTIANANWSAGNPIQLQWPSVTGAASYHLFMRNTTSPANSTTGTLDWVEQTAGLNIEVSDPNQSQTIVATGVSPWSLNLGSAAGPWAFGNHIQFAVTAADALGFQTPIDTNKLLDTADTFGGLITGATPDPSGLAAPFAVTTELGDTFIKTVRLNFSEPMLTSSVPVVTSLGARVTVKKVLASAWANGNVAPAPLDSANTVYEQLQLQNSGSCTEVLVARSPGDSMILVRDASYFAAGAANSVIFFTGGTFFAAGGPPPVFTAESDGISAVDQANNIVTLASPLPAAISLAANSNICALQNAAITAVPSGTGTSLTVASAQQFAYGDVVLYYEPQGASAPVADFMQVLGVDTTTNTVLISAAPSAGHTAASLLIPLPPFLGDEILFRGTQSPSIIRDIAGGPGAQFVFSNPIGGLVVGDKILVDADGDLRTTDDQALVTVTALAFAPTATPLVYSFTADVPASITLIHGRAKVRALGDSFSVSGTKDTSGNGTLDPHRAQFSPDGTLF